MTPVYFFVDGHKYASYQEEEDDEFFEKVFVWGKWANGKEEDYTKRNRRQKYSVLLEEDCSCK